MNFEYDRKKAVSNEKKHGVSFEDIQVLWNGSYVTAQAKTQGESRYLIIGQIDEIFYSCIYTIRNSNIRLISARRSNKKEVEFYHEHS